MIQLQKNKYAYITLLLSAVALGFLFQNCGQAMESGVGTFDYELQEEQEWKSFEEQPSAVEIDDINFEASAVKKYELPVQTTPLVERSKLNWNFQEANPSFQNAIRGLATRCEEKRIDFVNTARFSPIIYDEGLLPGDPRIEKMKNVKIGFDKLMDVAFCVYFAETLSHRANALNTVTRYISDWNRVYVGDGNPINDRFFIKLYLATDLVFPKMNANQINQIRQLAARMDKKEIQFMSGLSANDDRRKNNWMTRHLMIRTMSNIILNKATVLGQLKTAVNNDINRQYTAPTNFRLSACANLRSIGSYGSFDLQQRDAFIYHASGLEELAPLLLLKPDFINPTPKNKLLNALNVTKPYVLSTKNHPEFRCTTVQYDRDKLKLNPSLGGNWNPHNHRVLYRYTRVIWPGTRDWTSRFVTPDYAPWFKIVYTGKGDVL